MDSYKKSDIRLRFAPSPNGYMHLGHSFSALLNVEVAKALNGKFIIRMEDIDQLRCNDVFKMACIEDLAKIGVISDELVLYQSDRMAAYKDATEQLQLLGVIYPCLATRGEIKQYYKTRSARYDPDGALIYPNLYKGLSQSARDEIINGETDFAYRLDMQKAVELIDEMGAAFCFKTLDLDEMQLIEQAFDPMVWGDVVIARKDIGTSYHLSVVVDDAHQGINLIIRGMDLYHSTYIHHILQILLGLKLPRYFHHALIKDDALGKLSKSNKSLALRRVIERDPALYFISDLLADVNMRKMVKNIKVLVAK